MKSLQSLFAAVFLSAFITIQIPLQTGCKAGHGRWDPTTQVYSTEVEGDPIVVNAQRVRGLALVAMSRYWEYEKDNRAKLWAISHDFKHVADDFRSHGEAYIDALSATIKDYQRLRTPENQLSIENALTLVQGAVDRAEAMYEKAKAAQ